MMHLKTILVTGLTVLATTALLTACSSDDDSSGGGSGGKTAPATATAFVDVLAGEFCDMTSYCCTSKSRTYDATTCKASMVDIYSMVVSEANYDQSKAQACLNFVASAKGYYASHCVGEKDGPLENSSDDPCSALFGSGDSGQGKKLPGETCADSSDCAPSSKGDVYCQISFSTGDNGSVQHSACQVQLPGKAGDGPCQDGEGPPSAELIQCSQKSGLRCNGSTNVCVALAKTGETCGWDMDCEAALYCSSGKCTARVDVGADCAEFGGPTCKESLFCDKTTSKCKALGEAGSACTKWNECKSNNCSEAGVCMGDDDDFMLDLACPVE